SHLHTFFRMIDNVTFITLMAFFKLHYRIHKIVTAEASLTKHVPCCPADPVTTPAGIIIVWLAARPGKVEMALVEMSLIPEINGNAAFSKPSYHGKISSVSQRPDALFHSFIITAGLNYHIHTDTVCEISQNESEIFRS